MNVHALGLYHALHMGQVRDNTDPDGRGRIKVMLLATQMEIWAYAVVPSAGHGYGVSCLPRKDEIVVVAFVTPEQAFVLGSIWSGQDSSPSEADPVEDHYVIRTPAGTVMDFDDANGPQVKISTPDGHHITINDGNGGEIVIERDGETIKLTSSEINITSSGTVSVNASTVSISASMVDVDAGMAKFSGVVKADTVIANSVVGTSYSPGAGNMW
jgi:uncharacterized protein involved in type VI secretion and phage assembly